MAALPDHLMPAAVGAEPLPREVLEEHQRERVLAAAAAVFAEHGYRATTVDRLVAAGQVGVGTFYSLFDGKQDCFLRLYDRVVDDARERLAAAAAEGTWAERVRAGLGALLALVDAEPERAQVVLVEAPAAGPEARRRRDEALAELTAALRAGRSVGGAAEAPPRFEEAAVAGLAWVVGLGLLAGDEACAGLPEAGELLLSPNAGAAPR